MCQLHQLGIAHVLTPREVVLLNTKTTVDVVLDFYHELILFLIRDIYPSYKKNLRVSNITIR